MAKGYVPYQKEYNKNKPIDPVPEKVSIKTFYKTADNNTADKVIRSDLFDAVAEKIAVSFGNKKDGVSYTQFLKLILVFALIRLLKKYLYSTNGKDEKSVVNVQGLDNAYNFNNQWYFFCGR